VLGTAASNNAKLVEALLQEHPGLIEQLLQVGRVAAGRLQPACHDHAREQASPTGSFKHWSQRLAGSCCFCSKRDGSLCVRIAQVCPLRGPIKH
jgi:hypothetical protein